MRPFAYDVNGPTIGTAVDPFGYHAQDGYFGDETGLYYCQNRYYDPGTGRWVTRDPIGYDGGINLYGYCGAGPVGSSDAQGLQVGAGAEEDDSKRGGDGGFFDPGDPEGDGNYYPWMDPDNPEYRPPIPEPTPVPEPPDPPMPDPAPQLPYDPTAGLDTNTAAAEEDCPEGSFSIWDWSGYPDDVEKPNGTFRDIEGAEYENAKKAADRRNKSLRRFLGIRGNRQVEIHEIKPVKQGGSPTDVNNKMIIDKGSHSELTNWWNGLGRGC